MCTQLFWRSTQPQELRRIVAKNGTRERGSRASYSSATQSLQNGEVPVRADAEHVELGHLRVPYNCDVVFSSRCGLGKSIGIGGRRRGAQPRWCSRGFPYVQISSHHSPTSSLIQRLSITPRLAEVYLTMPCASCVSPAQRMLHHSPDPPSPVRSA